MPIPRRFLIVHVDDDADDRELFAKALSRSGLAAELVSLASAQAAVLYASKLSEYEDAQRPDLMVVDHTMPWMSGQDLIGFVRQSPMGAVPIVILSGSSDPACEAAWRSAGAVAFLRKQVDMNGLTAELASLARWLTPDAMVDGRDPAHPDDR